MRLLVALCAAARTVSTTTFGPRDAARITRFGDFLLRPRIGGTTVGPCPAAVHGRHCVLMQRWRRSVIGPPRRRPRALHGCARRLCFPRWRRSGQQRLDSPQGTLLTTMPAGTDQPPWAQSHATQGQDKSLTQWKAMRPASGGPTMARLVREHAAGMKEFSSCVAAGRHDCERPLPPGLARARAEVDSGYGTSVTRAGDATTARVDDPGGRSRRTSMGLRRRGQDGPEFQDAREDDGDRGRLLDRG